MRMVALLLLLYSALPAAAQQGPARPEPAAEEDKNQRVEEAIVVTATRSERAVSDLPLSTTVISEADLKAAPALFADDVLRSIPGVQMPFVGSTASITTRQQVSMRGLGGMRALVLLDGIPIHDPYYGTVQWQKVPLNSLRQVELVRGGNASLFGNFALGGTINLLTRPVDTNTVRADVAYGTHSTERGSVSADHSFSEALAVRFSHLLYDTAGFIRQPDSGPVDVNGWNDTAVTSARLEFKPRPGTSGFLKASWSQIDVSNGTVIAYSKRDILDIAGAAHHMAGSRGLVSVTAFTQRQEEHAVSTSVVGAARDSEFKSQDSLIPASVAGASLEWSTQRSGPIAFLSVGLDVQQVEAEEARISFNRTGAITQRATVGGRQRFAGLFAQASWRPSDRMEVLVSGRLDNYRNERGREEIVNGTLTSYPSATTTQFDPRISVRYALGDRSALRGAVYRAFKAPTLRELYRNTQTGVTLSLGNPFLQPETLEGGELGWEWAGRNAHVEVILYRSDIEGLQNRIAVEGRPNTIQLVNLGDTRSQGVEAMADFRLSPTWSVNAGYTWADATIVADPNPALVGKLIPEVSPHAATLGFRYRGRTGITFDARGRSFSRQYGEPANLAVTPSHHIVDLSASHPIRSWADVYVIAENVLDESYYYALTPTAFRSGQPRTITAGFRFDFAPGRPRSNG
jgi:outer membrane receptor protein involved in Fe transport